MVLHKMYQSGDVIEAKDAPVVSLLLKNVLVRSISIHRTTPAEYDTESGLAPRRFETNFQHENDPEIDPSNMVDDTPILDGSNDNQLERALELFPENKVGMASDADVNMPAKRVTGRVV